MDTELEYTGEAYVEDLIEAKVETAVIRFECAEYYWSGRETE
jgi:hypothetical protein